MKIALTHYDDDEKRHSIELNASNINYVFLPETGERILTISVGHEILYFEMRRVLSMSVWEGGQNDL